MIESRPSSGFEHIAHLIRLIRPKSAPRAVFIPVQPLMVRGPASRESRCRPNGQDFLPARFDSNTPKTERGPITPTTATSLELVFNECGLPEPLGQRHACFQSKLYLCRRSLNSRRRISRRNSQVHLSTSPSTFDALSRHE